MTLENELQKAAREYQRAAEHLVEATARAFPIGSSVAVTIGRARIIGRVTSAGGFWWADPAKVTIRNAATGRLRQFSATHKGHEAEIILP